MKTFGVCAIAVIVVLFCVVFVQLQVIGALEKDVEEVAKQIRELREANDKIFEKAKFLEGVLKANQVAKEVVANDPDGFDAWTMTFTPVPK